MGIPCKILVQTDALAVYTLVWQFGDGSNIQYGPGRFDNYCVYVRRNDGGLVAPSDADYFADLATLAKVHSAKIIYEAFVRVYDYSEKSISLPCLEEIERSKVGFGNDSELMQRTLIILHMCMVAENNKRNTKLGKRIKRLGVFYLLFENYDHFAAANFMRGMNWEEIAKLCHERGF